MIKCNICNKEYKDFSGLGVHIKMIHHISTKEYYDKFLKTFEPICKTCGKITNFLNLNMGYRLYCSRKCVSNNVELNKLKIEKTDYLTARQKAKQTCLNKYGVENTTQLISVQNKMKTTCLNKYGVTHISKTDSFKEKFKNTCFEKYGVENPNSDPTIKDKKRKLFLEKYNSPSPFGSKIIQEKSKQTLLRKYGADNPMAIPDVQIKFKETCVAKYGVDNPSKIQSIRLDIKTKLLSLAYKKLILAYPDYTPLFLESEYIGCLQAYQWKCNKCSTVFDGRTSNRFILYCPKCDTHKSNTIEQQIYNILNNLQILNIKINKRSILPSGLELDFFLPDYNIAIEFNGNYWHSEISGEKTKNYHLNKLKECEKLGIKLIQITEDEWLYKQKIVINRLKNILGKTKHSIYGRKCTIQLVNSKIKNRFLNKYHIQGDDKSNINLGLFYKNHLVSIMTFSKRRKALGALNQIGHYELSRFCSINNFNIIGGASKLLKYFEQIYKPIQLVSYADKRWSIGQMYLKLNFVLDHISKPNYWYTYTYFERLHRFNFRKNVLSSKLPLFNIELSEWENMKNNGYDRIWDCGNLVFIKKYDI